MTNAAPLAVFLLAAGFSAVQAQQPLLVDGSFEMIGTTPDAPGDTFRDLCTLSGVQVNCSMSKEMGAGILSTSMSGTLHGNRIVSRAEIRFRVATPGCSFTSSTSGTGTIELSPNGSFSNVWTGGPVSYSSISGPCAATFPHSSPAGPPSKWVGTWRQLDTGMPAVTVLPMETTLVTRDGRRITVNLEDLKTGKPSVELMELKAQLAFAPPAGGTITLPLYGYPRTGAADPPVYAGMKNLDDLAIDGAQATAAWAKANPDKAALAVLGLAINIVMPYTTAFQAAAGGMTFAEGAGIGFMTAFAPSAVSSLVTSAASGEGAWKATGKAVVRGTVSGVESLPSTVAGSAVSAVGQALAGESLKTTVNVLSGVASSAGDQLVSGWHDKAAALSEAASPTIPDLATPTLAPPSGGIELTFDR